EQEEKPEERSATDDLDVHARELARERDPVRANGAEDDPDCGRAGDRDQGRLYVQLQPVKKRPAVVPDDAPLEAGEKLHAKVLRTSACENRTGALSARAQIRVWGLDSSTIVGVQRGQATLPAKRKSSDDLPSKAPTWPRRHLAQPERPAPGSRQD